MGYIYLAKAMLQ